MFFFFYWKTSRLATCRCCMWCHQLSCCLATNTRAHKRLMPSWWPLKISSTPQFSNSFRTAVGLASSVTVMNQPTDRRWNIWLRCALIITCISTQTRARGSLWAFTLMGQLLNMSVTLSFWEFISQSTSPSQPGLEGSPVPLWSHLFS